MKELKTKQKYTTTFLERGSFWFFGIGMLFYYQIVGSYLNTYLLLRGVDKAEARKQASALFGEFGLSR